jgi:5'-deoxynucleotidase YfbR-like HD superfamily hydrolase
LRGLNYRENIEDYDFSNMVQMDEFRTRVIKVVAEVKNSFQSNPLIGNDIKNFSEFYKEIVKELKNIEECTNDKIEFPETQQGFYELFTRIEEIQNTIYSYIDEIFLSTALFEKTKKSLNKLNTLYQTCDGPFGKTKEDIYGARLITIIPLPDDNIS